MGAGQAGRSRKAPLYQSPPSPSQAGARHTSMPWLRDRCVVTAQPKLARCQDCLPLRQGGRAKQAAGCTGGSACPAGIQRGSLQGAPRAFPPRQRAASPLPAPSHGSGTALPAAAAGDLSLPPASPRPAQLRSRSASRQARRSAFPGPPQRLVPALQPLLSAYLWEYLVFQWQQEVITELSLQSIKANWGSFRMKEAIKTLVLIEKYLLLHGISGLPVV